MATNMKTARKSAAADEAVEAKTASDGSVASAADRVSESILQGIRSGSFVPGQHLLEPDLTRRLGISRSRVYRRLRRGDVAG